MTVATNADRAVALCRVVKQVSVDISVLDWSALRTRVLYNPRIAHRRQDLES